MIKFSGISAVPLDRGLSGEGVTLRFLGMGQCDMAVGVGREAGLGGRGRLVPVEEESIVEGSEEIGNVDFDGNVEGWLEELIG